MLFSEEFVVKKIFNVSRSLTMESLVSNDKYLEFNSKINREPVEICKNSVPIT